MWYRIELNKDRSVRTCVEVEGSLNEGRSVHYVEADSKASAIAILAAEWDRTRDKARSRARAVQAQLRAIGYCQHCRKSPATEGALCGPCYARGKLRKQTGTRVRSNRKTDEEKAAALLRRKEVVAANKRAYGAGYGRRYVTRKILREVLTAFDRDPISFRGWLVAKISEFQEKIDAKKTIADHFPKAAE